MQHGAVAACCCNCAPMAGRGTRQKKRGFGAKKRLILMQVCIIGLWSLVFPIYDNAVAAPTYSLRKTITVRQIGQAAARAMELDPGACQAGWNAARSRHLHARRNRGQSRGSCKAAPCYNTNAQKGGLQLAAAMRTTTREGPQNRDPQGGSSEGTQRGDGRRPGRRPLQETGGSRGGGRYIKRSGSAGGRCRNRAA